MHGDVDPVAETETCDCLTQSVGGDAAAGMAEHLGPPCRRAGALPKDEPLVQYQEHEGSSRRERWTKSSANNAGSLSITMDGGTKLRASTGGRGGPEGGTSA
eukprot:3171918-Pyramimonas_sp.AAC.1